MEEEDSALVLLTRSGVLFVLFFARIGFLWLEIFDCSTCSSGVDRARGAKTRVGGEGREQSFISGDFGLTVGDSFLHFTIPSLLLRLIPITCSSVALENREDDDDNRVDIDDPPSGVFNGLLLSAIDTSTGMLTLPIVEEEDGLVSLIPS